MNIQHGLGEITTGYKISFNIGSNFKINRHHHEHLTSYTWRSIQKENILLKIEYKHKSSYTNFLLNLFVFIDKQ